MSDTERKSCILKVGGMLEIPRNPKVKFTPTESSARRMAKANQEEHIGLANDVMGFKIIR